MIFELDNVELSFNGNVLLYGVYIKAEKGKITGILGPNGGGKTSLLKVFFGNLGCNNKLVRIDGKGTLKPLYSKKKVQLLAQTDFFPTSIKLKKLFNFYRVSWDEFASKFESFSDYKNYTVKKLSGGEKRILSIWLILKSQSEFIMLDEPFTHLAPIYKEIIKKEICNEKHNKAILLTDHLYKDLMEICDELYLLKDGCTKNIKGFEELKEAGYIRNF